MTTDPNSDHARLVAEAAAYCDDGRLANGINNVAMLVGQLADALTQSTALARLERAPFAELAEAETQLAKVRLEAGDLAMLGAKLEADLAACRVFCGHCSGVLKQIVDLADVNDETRKILRHLGNGLNDTARAADTAGTKGQA